MAWLLVALALSGASWAGARPIPFRSGWIAMAEMSGEEWHTMLHYGWRRDFAPGIHLVGLEEAGRRMQGTFGVANYLVHRTNGRSHQINVYAIGAAGVLQDEGDTRGAWFGSVEADAEDRRRYASISYTRWGAGDWLERDAVKARVGWAPYPAGFEDIAVWVIAQGEWERGDEEKLVAAGVLRVYWDRYLLEAGPRTDGTWMARFWTQSRF